jgi:hypothetical protein
LPRSRANAGAAWREPRASAHAGLEAVLSEVGGTTPVPPHPAAAGGALPLVATRAPSGALTNAIRTPGRGDDGGAFNAIPWSAGSETRAPAGNRPAARSEVRATPDVGTEEPAPRHSSRRPDRRRARPRRRVRGRDLRLSLPVLAASDGNPGGDRACARCCRHAVTRYPQSSASGG